MRTFITALLICVLALANPAFAQQTQQPQSTSEQQAASYAAAIQGAPSNHPVPLDHQVIGRNFFILILPNFREPSRSRSTLNTFDFDLIYGIQNRCESEIRSQAPSEVRSVLMVAIRNVPTTVIGTVLGAHLAGFADTGRGMGNYALYSGGAAVGSSIGAGFNAHAIGKQTAIGGCVVMMMNEAHRVGILRDVQVTYNTFPTRGPGIHRSSLRAPTADELDAAGILSSIRTSTASGDSTNDSTPVPVH